MRRRGTEDRGCENRRGNRATAYCLWRYRSKSGISCTSIAIAVIDKEAGRGAKNIAIIDSGVGITTFIDCSDIRY